MFQRRCFLGVNNWDQTQYLLNLGRIRGLDGNKCQENREVIVTDLKPPSLLLLGSIQGEPRDTMLTVTKARTGSKGIKGWPREFLRGKLLTKSHHWYGLEPICEPACRHLQWRNVTWRLPRELSSAWHLSSGHSVTKSSLLPLSGRKHMSLLAHTVSWPLQELSVH